MVCSRTSSLSPAMNASSRIALISLSLVAWVAADLPKKAPATKYSRLWNESPFTSKPIVTTGTGPVVNPLEDYALSGISPIPSGYRVTLLDKKNPEKRIVVDSDKPREGFKIISVSRKPGNPLGTVVQMSSGEVTGNISFDEKFITPTTPPAAPKGPPGAPGAKNPVPQPATTGQPPNQPRQPRPRVVAPPAPQIQPGQPGQPNPQLQQGRSSLDRTHRRR